MKIATWNLCLGLSNKKDTVCDYLAVNNITACCLQETEIPMNFPEDILIKMKGPNKHIKN